VSAFVVDDQTINRVLSHLSADEYRALVTAAFGDGTLWRDRPTDADLGAALRDLNVRAVLARYPDCSLEADDLPGPSPLLPYAYAPILVGAHQALKSLHCLLYQCSEGDVPETPLYQALDGLSNRWAHEIVSKLPEYDQAVWG
jgi:hypothetical protein